MITHCHWYHCHYPDLRPAEVRPVAHQDQTSTSNQSTLSPITDDLAHKKTQALVFNHLYSIMYSSQS